MTSIRLEHVSKIYGKEKACRKALAMLRQDAPSEDIFQATGCQVGLRRISLTIPGGGSFCIMGLSGSGKSTLVRHINRLIEPSCGEIWVGGTKVTELSETALRDFRQQKVSMVFQHFGLLPHLTVLQNAEYALRVRGLPMAAQHEQARYWLNEVGLSGHEESYPDALSGGMRQRVGLARALAAATDILLMDEPFSALDPLIRAKLQEQLLDLQQRLGKTIVFITHDVGEALKLGSQMAILNAGALVQSGTPQQLLEAPADDYVAEFMTVR